MLESCCGTVWYGVLEEVCAGIVCFIRPGLVGGLDAFLEVCAGCWVLCVCVLCEGVMCVVGLVSFIETITGCEKRRGVTEKREGSRWGWGGGGEGRRGEVAMSGYLHVVRPENLSRVGVYELGVAAVFSGL